MLALSYLSSQTNAIFHTAVKIKQRIAIWRNIQLSKKTNVYVRNRQMNGQITLEV